jgi:hypothetical protein
MIRSKLIAIALLTTTAAAAGQTSDEVTLTNLGTLTCTTMDAAEDAVADAQLSCSFNSASGQHGNFTGYIARVGQADIPQGKRVLVWSVLSTKQDTPLAALAGTYTGETGGRVAGRLIGGADRAVLLQPTTVTSQIGGTPQPSVLQLRLEPSRA